MDPNQDNQTPAPSTEPVVPTPEPTPGVTEPTPAPAPETPAPSFDANPAPSVTDSATPAAPVAENPGKTLGIVGFVLSLIGGTVISLVLGVLALNKSKKAGQKNGFALAAIIISAIGTVLGTIWIILIVTAANAFLQKCNELGPGTHIVNGTAINCTTSTTAN